MLILLYKLSFYSSCLSSMSVFLYSVFIFCLSFLFFYSVFLFCLFILSFYSVFLFCLSILSFYSVLLFCLSILLFLSSLLSPLTLSSSPIFTSLPLLPAPLLSSILPLSPPSTGWIDERIDWINILMRVRWKVRYRQRMDCWVQIIECIGQWLFHAWVLQGAGSKVHRYLRGACKDQV